MEPLDFAVLVVVLRRVIRPPQRPSPPSAAADHTQDILEAGAVSIVAMGGWTGKALPALGKENRIVITDS